MNWSHWSVSILGNYGVLPFWQLVLPPKDKNSCDTWILY
jgi:hypothetical protein